MGVPQAWSAAAMGLVKFGFGFYMINIWLWIGMWCEKFWNVLVWYKITLSPMKEGCGFGFLIEEELYLSGYSIFVCKKRKIRIMCSLSCVTFRDVQQL
jgi:hypothetical protein